MFVRILKERCIESVLNEPTFVKQGPHFWKHLGCSDSEFQKPQDIPEPTRKCFRFHSEC